MTASNGSLGKEQKTPATNGIDTTTPFGRLTMPFLARLFWFGATAKRLPRMVRKFVRKRYARYRPGPFDREVEGIRFRLYPAENHSDRTIAGRGELPEIPERAMLSPFIKPKMTFVDIGGNIGVYSLFVAQQTGNNAHIISIEPHPRTFEKLVFNCLVNDFGSIRCVKCGIGPAPVDAELYSDGGGNIGGASMLREASGDKVAIKVPVRPLADVLFEAGVGSVDLLKIDIEGFEDRALAGFFDDQACRALFPKAILIETVHRHLWEHDMIERLLMCGYRECGATDENILLEHCS